MLALRQIPTDYLVWNETWGAPFGFGRGHLAAEARGLNREGKAIELARAHGPFVMQPCCSTRRFEYPWAYDQLSRLSAKTVVEVGGGLSGFQFAISAAGMRVINVDPGGAGFSFDERTALSANRVFGTNVEVIGSRLADAGIPDTSVDAVTCLSTLEHLEDDEIGSILGETRRILRPEGRLILTVDLFLNLTPFTHRTLNSFGRNVPIWQLATASGYRLDVGSEPEILSSPTFDQRHVLEHLETYLVGDTYPVLAQLLVLSKRA